MVWSPSLLHRPVVFCVQVHASTHWKMPNIPLSPWTAVWDFPFYAILPTMHTQSSVVHSSSQEIRRLWRFAFVSQQPSQSLPILLTVALPNWSSGFWGQQLLNEMSPGGRWPPTTLTVAAKWKSQVFATQMLVALRSVRGVSLQTQLAWCNAMYYIGIF